MLNRLDSSSPSTSRIDKQDGKTFITNHAQVFENGSEEQITKSRVAILKFFYNLSPNERETFKNELLQTTKDTELHFIMDKSSLFHVSNANSTTIKPNSASTLTELSTHSPTRKSILTEIREKTLNTSSSSNSYSVPDLMPDKMEIFIMKFSNLDKNQTQALYKIINHISICSLYKTTKFEIGGKILENKINESLNTENSSLTITISDSLILNALRKLVPSSNIDLEDVRNLIAFCSQGVNNVNGISYTAAMCQFLENLKIDVSLNDGIRRINHLHNLLLGNDFNIKVLDELSKDYCLFGIRIPNNILSSYLKTNHWEGVNLSGADMSGVYLSGADLGGADLSGANLNGAILNGAYLLDANLSGAILSGAILSGADLSRANLNMAILNEANLSRTNLYRASLKGANLETADLSDADLSNVDLSSVDLSGARLNGAILSNATIGINYISELDFTGAILEPNTKINLKFSNYLDRDFNHINNPKTGSILSQINSIDDKHSDIKLDLMEQVIDRLNIQQDISIFSLIEPLKDILFNSSFNYLNSKKINTFVVDKMNV